MLIALRAEHKNTCTQQLVVAWLNNQIKKHMHIASNSGLTAEPLKNDADTNKSTNTLPIAAKYFQLTEET